MKNQKGYIRLVLIIFAIIMGLLLFPIKLPKSDDYPKFKQKAPGDVGVYMPNFSPNQNQRLHLDWFLIKKTP